MRMVLLGLSVLVLAVTASAARPERLVFASDRAGNTDIYLGARRLTSSQANDYSPAWSPDGRWIAFVSTRDGDEELYLMSATGSQVRQLTRNKVKDQTPAWSPDGRWLVFASERGGNRARELYVMPSKGGPATRIVRSPLRWNESFAPVWSPDGRWIAFVSNRAGLFGVDIYVVRANGTQLRRLTRSTRDDGFPADSTMPDWSPDGSRIAFVSNRDGNNELYLMNRDGTNPRRLTITHRIFEAQPRWSSDGTRLLFGTSTKLYVKRIDANGREPLGRGWDADWLGP